MHLENLPLDLPFELCEIIFGYLNSRDLLTCCLVCKSWLNFFNKCSNRRSVLLTIDENRSLKDIFDCTRKFLRLKLLKLNGSMVLKILEFYASTVEALEIENCDAKCEMSHKDLTFSHLKCLSISSCPGDIITKIFRHPCDNLKCLVLYRLYGPSFNHVLELLKANDSLEEVNFYLDETNNFFNKDISERVKFKLKSIFISYKSNCDLSVKTLANIERFLRAQGDSLEVISLVNSVNTILLYNIWNDLKAVERFYCFSSEQNSPCGFQREFDLKPSLVDFEIHAIGQFSLELSYITPILRSAVKLKYLGVWRLEIELVDFIARNCHNLRKISCASVDSDCLTFYNEMKSKIGINDKIKIHQYL